MKRKPNSRRLPAKSPQTRCVQAYEDAQPLLAALAADLPHASAAHSLTMLAAQALDSLCRHLEDPQAATEVPTEGLPWHPGGAEDLAKMAIKIANATLNYARLHPRQLARTISQASEWPAIVSLDPTRDVRRVVRNAGGEAARFYAPLLSSLGEDSLFPNPNVRLQSIVPDPRASAMGST